jgi:hypothetical protein
LLYIIAACEVRALIVEIDEVGVPVGGILAGEERCIGGHADNIAVAFDMQQIQTFG